MSLLRKIKIIGEVDNGNSSTTILDPAGINVFTGVGIEILDHGVVFVTVSTDVASAVDGLSIQQSSDGVNWDHTDDYTIAAGANKNFSINPHSKFCRVVYTNGPIIQGYFRLQTIHKGNSKPSSHRIKDEIIGDDDCTLMKAALTGENGFGEWHNVKTTHDGNLTISDNSNGMAIAEGNITGKTFIHKFGNAPNFNIIDGYVTIWDGADQDGIVEPQYTYSTAAIIDSISSTDNGDNQDILIEGLDVNYDVVIQIITLTGQTRKALDTNLIRVYRMYNYNATPVAGTIYCYENDTTVTTPGIPDDTTLVRAIIRPVHQQTLMAVYTVPAGKTGYMRDWYLTTAGARKTSVHEMHLSARSFGGVFLTKHVASILTTGTSSIQHKYEEPEMFMEKTDIEMHVNTDEDIASISAGFDIVLVDN